MGFRLECLKIHKETNNKKLLKVLKPEEPYNFFREDTPIQCKELKDNFFGSNIHVSAIVGKNGCGKSTLLDILYIMINNFVYLFERGQDQVSRAPLYYVPGLYADLYYSSETSHYNLSCNDKCIILKKSDKVSEINVISREYNEEIVNLEIKEKERAPILNKKN